MAAKKRKKRTSKKKEAEAKKASGFWPGVGAVGLIIAGIILPFGLFISNPVPHGMWDGSWSALGAATIIAPIALIYLGAMKFLSEDHKIPTAKMVGVICLLVFLASWFHVTFLHTAADGVSLA